MCYNLLQVANYQVNNAETVRARMISIMNILADPSQMISTSLGNCSELLALTVMDNIPVICNSQSLETLVYSTLAATKLASIQINAPSQAIYNISQLMTQLGLACLSSFAIGETPRTIYVNGLKSVSAVVSASTLQSNVFSLPTTDFQQFEGVIGDSFSFNRTFLGRSSVYGATISYESLPTSGSVVITNSSVVNVQLANLKGGSSASSSSARRLESKKSSLSFRVVLNNPDSIDYTFHPSTHQRINCDSYSTRPYAINALCPYGITYSVQCPSYKKGYFNITCPSVQHVPTCKTFDGRNYVESSHCIVANYSSKATSCLCSYNLDAANSQESSYGIAQSTSVKITSSYKLSAPALTMSFVPYKTSVAATGYIVISNIGFLAIVFVICICVQFYYERSDMKMKIAPGKGDEAMRTIPSFYESLFRDEFNKLNKLGLFARKLLLDHYWFKFGSTLRPTGQPMQWSATTVLIGRVLSNLLAVSLIAWSLFYDNGHCEAEQSEYGCKHSTTLFNIRHDCTWNSTNQFCAYNSLPITADMIIICSAIVLVVCIPINALFEFAVDILSILWPLVPLTENYNTDDNARYIEYKQHEFEVVQNQRSKMLLGARLSKISTLMESLLNSQLESELIADQLRSIADNRAAQNPTPAAISRYQLDITIDRPFNALLNTVLDSRAQAEQLKKLLLYLKTEKERDVVMFKHFLLHNLPSYLQPFARHAFFHEKNVVFATRLSLSSRRYKQLATLLAGFYVLAHIIGVLYFVIYFAITVGLQGQNLWIIVFWVSVVVDALMVQILKLYLKWILLVNWLIGKHIRAFTRTLYKRSKLILIRSSGLMRDSTSLVQHLNPACRVAREMPELHISRLLLSLADHDIAIYKNNQHRGHKYLWISKYLGMVPYWVYDSLGETSLVLLLFAIFYAVYLLYFVSFYAAVFVPIGLVIVIALSFLKKSLIRPIVYLSEKRPSSLFRAVAAGPPMFFDLASVKEEVKDDDIVDSSVKFKGSFGSRMSSYKPGSLDTRIAITPDKKVSASPSETNDGVAEEMIKLKTMPKHHFDPIPIVNPPSYPKTDGPQGPMNVKKNKIPLRQARRVARNEQILSAGPGGSPGASAKYRSRPDNEHEKKMINNATSLSDLLLVSSDRDLPMIDILSRVASETPAGMTSQGLSGPGAAGVDVELWASNSPRNRFKLHLDEIDVKPKFEERLKLAEKSPLSEHDIFFE